MARARRSDDPVVGMLRIDHRPQAVELSTYLDAATIERATEEGNRWIKSLRHVTVGAQRLRDRFTYRGDSFWWFIELALAKEGAVSAFKTLAALEALFDRESPRALTVVSGDHVTRTLARSIARLHNVPCNVAGGLPRPGGRRRHDTCFHLGETLAARLRPAPRPPRHDVRLAIFVHTAFWRSTHGDRYLGPIIRALRERLPPGDMELVGIGPRTTWQMRSARRMPRTPREEPPPFHQIERYAPLRAVRPSLQVWLKRNAMWRAALASPELRQSMNVRGCDLSPVLLETMAHALRVHVPWSARAMDEVAATLDVLRPRLALTYAEAGAWGRALVIEGRRRGIPVIGVQHGFIGRHWLNYRHEPDEMLPSADNASDPGYPLPDLTLLFDGYAAAGLQEMGNVPPSALRVTGSPELDALSADMANLSAEQIEAARTVAGAASDQAVVLVLSKFTEIRPVYRALVDALRDLPAVRAVVKCHPAEGPEAYAGEGGRAPNLTVLESDTSLAALLRLSQLVVTVNSTLALHAMALGIPALALQMPNNLSPFVDGGAMAGLQPDEPIAPALQGLLYDDTRRKALADRAKAFLARYAIRSDGGAVRRATDSIVRLLERTERTERG